MTDDPKPRRRPAPKTRTINPAGEKSFEVYQARAGTVPPEREFEAWLTVDGMRSPVNPFYAETGMAAIAKAAAFWDAELAKVAPQQARGKAANKPTSKRRPE